MSTCRKRIPYGMDEGLVYDGDWKQYFRYIADCLYTYASQRDKMNTWVHPCHDRTEQILPPLIGKGHAGRLCRHLPASVDGNLQGYVAQLHRRAEIRQGQGHNQWRTSMRKTC